MFFVEYPICLRRFNIKSPKQNLMRLLASLCLLFLVLPLLAQEPPLYLIESKKGESLVYSLDLKEGALIEDLSWAWNSSVACFIGPRQEFFKGNHVFFQTQLPARSTMEILLVPDDPNSNMSLYAYSGSADRLPPNLTRCVSCEADYHRERPSVNRPNPDHRRTVELRAVNNPYTVTIGVAGAAGVTEGSFKLQITIK